MDKEYGVELDVDLSSFNAKLDEAVSKVKKASNDIEKTTRTIKVTGVEGLDKIKVDTAPIKRLKSELQDTLDVKKRLETGQIKVFDSTVFDSKSMAKADAEYEKNRLANSGFLDYGKLEADRNAFEQLGESINGVDSNLEEATTSGNQFLVTIERLVSRRLGRRTLLGTEFFNKTFFNDMKDGTTTLKSFSTSLLKLGGITVAFYGVKKLFDIAMNSIKKAKEETEKIKKVVLGVFTAIGNAAKQVLSKAVGYIENFFSKAMSSYMSFDKQLSENMQQTWAGFGSFMAPILEYVISLFQRLLAYVNATIKVLTGIDFVARANAKAMNGVASATNKATKALAGFDELQNLDRETGGGGGISGGTIEIPDIDVSGVESFAQKIKELIEQDDWFSIGIAVRDKIIEGLDSIPWAEIQAKAGQIGKRLAEFLNGLFTPNVDGKTLGASLGRTLAEAINTAIEFLYNFLKNLEWDKIAKNIIDFIVNAIENIKWEKVIKVAQYLADGILTILKTALKKLEEKLPEWSEAFEKFLYSEEGQKLLDTIAQIILTWKDLKSKLSDILDDIIGRGKALLKQKLKSLRWDEELTFGFTWGFASGLESASDEIDEGSEKVQGSIDDFFSDVTGKVDEGSAKVEKQAYKSSNKIGESYNDGIEDSDTITAVKMKYTETGEAFEEGTIKNSAITFKSGNKIGTSYIDGVGSVDTTTIAKNKANETLTALNDTLGIMNGKSSKTSEIGHSAGAGFIWSLEETDTETPAKEKANELLKAMNETLSIFGGKSKKTEEMGDITGKSLTTGLNNSNAVEGTKEYFDSVYKTINAATLKTQKETEKGGKGLGSTLGDGIGSGFNSVINNSLNMVKRGLNEVIGLFNKSADNIGRNYSVKVKGSIANAGNAAADILSNVTAQIQRVPYLKIGTNEVYSEGIAYLHAGEKVVPANVAKGGYDSSDNKETNMLLRVLIDTLENKDFNATIGKDEVGRASVDYINKMKRITGGAVV